MAVFDVDGTLTKGYYIVKFARFLSRSGMFSKVELDSMENLLYRYKSGICSYKIASEEAVLHFARGVKGAKQDDVMKAGELYIKTHKTDKFNFTDGLIGMLKSRNYKIMILSASPLEIIKPFAENIGNDATFATILKTEHGLFTGGLEQDCSKDDVKKTLVEDYFNRNGIDAKSSVGFADTEADLAFLGVVGYPVAINPNTALETEARKKGWLICVEGDDVKGMVGKYIP